MAALFWCQNSLAQLLDFELTVTPTDETCTGNGTLTFNVDQPTPGAVILYSVYLLPDITTSVSTSFNPFVGSLSAGTYKVIALETLGILSLEVAVNNIVINNDEPEQLTIQGASIAHNCNVGGEIVITATSGTPVGYEISLGPQIMPYQESNIFVGMPEGQYLIFAYNECGEVTPLTYFHELNPSPPVVSDPIFQNTTGGDCTTVNIVNTIEYPEGTAITYPLTILYTVYSPDGTVFDTETQFYETGVPDFIEFSHTFPVVDDPGYTYDLSITNGCGQHYGRQGLTVNPAPEVALQAIPIPCGHNYLTVSVSQYMPPYTMQFLEVPNGFDPVAFNGAYPGPFTEGSVNFGSETVYVPEGTYHVKITDGCGRVSDASLDVLDLVPVPNAVGRNNGCYAVLGRITVSIPSRKIVSAIITAAPAAYTQALPQNVSSFINSSGTLIINNLPVGTYTLHLVDDCGHEYDVEVTILPFTEQNFSATAFSDCTVGMGAVRVISGNGALVEMTLVSAPELYSIATPQNVSAYIDSQGKLYMDNLPEGTYTFSGTDICGIQRTAVINVVGYQPTTGTPFIFDPHCNSWSITLSDAASGGAPTYWLQKQNPGNINEWMHPDTNIVYAEGTTPTAANSYALPNNQTTNNLDFEGRFRVVSAVETVGTGVALKLCFNELGFFDYQQVTTINEIYDVSCGSTTSQVFVDASGPPPLIYEIISKDGDTSFTLNNGQNNIFTGLAPGVYEFKVTNACGGTEKLIRNINLLPNLVEATVPHSMLSCIGQGDSQFQEFDLTSRATEILGNQSPNAYTVTYYTNYADADAGTNAIAEPEQYTNTSSPQSIFARIVHNHVNVCNKVVEFELQVSEEPVITMEESAVLCNNEGAVTLTANPGYDVYQWSTGASTSSIVVTEPGVYSVRIGKDYVIDYCWTEAQIEVVLSGTVEDFSFEIKDWTVNDNTITVISEGPGTYEYSLDGLSYQDSPVFNGLPTGVYTVYIRDISGCGVISEEVAVLNYPKFFTPNNDGENDNWRIEFSWFEPDMMVFVYDRYGKLLTSFDGQSIGWDGTLNGYNLPSTDYWFVAQREDGRIFKGHFSMIR